MQVIDKAVQRIRADETAARKAGFAPKPPIYAAGTQINAIGKSNLKASRADFDALPDWEDATDQFIEVIEGEDRRDLDTSTDVLQFHEHDGTTYLTMPRTLADQGRLQNVQYPIQLEAVAAKQLFNAISPSGSHGAAFLSKVDPHTRQVTANMLLARMEDEPKDLRIRTRKGDGDTRSAFATVTPAYKPFDVNVLAGMLRDAMPPDSKADISYDGKKASLSAMYHAPELEDFAAGDMFKAGIVFTTADDGTHSVSAEAVLWRNLCLNLIIIDKSVVSLGRAVHKGDTWAMREHINEMIAKGSDAIGHFQEQWVKAEADDIMRRCTPTEAIGRLVHRGIVNAPGFSRRKDELVSRLVASYHKEPGYGTTAIVNAITRSAHEHHWGSMWSIKDLERQASVLLANTGKSKLYSLDVPGNAEETEFVNNIHVSTHIPYKEVTLDSVDNTPVSKLEF